VTVVPIEGAEAARIAVLLDDWAKALRAKDIDAIMAVHASDVRAFDCHSGVQLRGADAYRRHLETCLPCMQGRVIFELHDLGVTARGDVGFCHFLARCGATSPDGSESASWFRGTAGFRRTGGGWRIMHGHLSAPFDPESRRALLNLEPERVAAAARDPRSRARPVETPMNATEEVMTAEISRADDRAQIRRLIDDWARAARAADIDGIMACYSPDVRSFDAIAQLQFKGAEAYRRHWQACLAMCPGPMILEIHDLGLEVGDGLAFAHYLLRCGATDEDGEVKAGWTRATVCLRKKGARWAVVHEHFSAPFDVATGKALLDLTPEPAERASAA
jgi:ketosteroid isomerase-like protein